MLQLPQGVWDKRDGGTMSAFVHGCTIPDYADHGQNQCIHDNKHRIVVDDNNGNLRGEFLVPNHVADTIINMMMTFIHLGPGEVSTEPRNS